MVFWLAVFVGGLFAWIAVRSGFYATWTMFFNLVLSACAAIFLAPLATANIPAATATSYGYALTLMSIAVATLLVAYGICFACLSGRFYVGFPEMFDKAIAGVLGFLTGFLVCSFVTFALCLTPLAQIEIPKIFRFDAPSQKANIAYVCWWSDRLHNLVSPLGDETTSQQAVEALLAKAKPPAAKQSKPDTPVEPVGPAAPPPPVPIKTVKPDANQVPAKAKESPEGVKENERPIEPKITALPQEPKAIASVEPTRPPVESPRPPVAPSRPHGELLEEEVARRRALVDTPGAMKEAVANRDIRIIDVDDVCAANQFNPEQAGLLRSWVSEGGVLWANNNVLTLFGVRSSKLAPGDGALCCTVSGRAEVSPILAGCTKVALTDTGGKSHSLSYNGAIPLLVLENDIPLKHKAGTACWSLVPFGKGWISDPKLVDTTQYDGARFWRNFCQFCLRKGPSDAPPGEKPLPGNEEPPTVAPQGPLSGAWQASAGAQFRIEDDGKTATIDLLSSNVLQLLTGKLVRPDGNSDSKTLTGTFTVVFMANVRKQSTVHVTGTLDDANHLSLRCADWPVLGNNGKILGTRVFNVTWIRSRFTPARPMKPIRPEDPSAIPLPW